MQSVEFSTCTLSYLEETFGLESNLRLDALDDWLAMTATITDMEQYQLQHL
ncbi:MAG: hypothetical protein AAF849_05310 [Bacteroidota bacterium]